MTKKLKLAIVGRPNVGKSALFNRICKRRIAIVDESEGVTRDRLQAEGVFNDRVFDVVDTGGIDPRSDDTFGGEISEQAKRAIQEADSVVMVVDGKIGISVLDQELAD
ncbi:MAG: GTPase Der, partial [Chlamydiae bacterium]|nr:GTPase Der [Chlamydiota bacterium]